MSFQNNKMIAIYMFIWLRFRLLAQDNARNFWQQSGSLPYMQSSCKDFLSTHSLQEEMKLMHQRLVSKEQMLASACHLFNCHSDCPLDAFSLDMSLFMTHAGPLQKPTETSSTAQSSALFDQTHLLLRSGVKVK